MDNVVDRYFPVVNALELEQEKIEERIFTANDTRANIEDLYALKHKGMLLRHAIEPLIEDVHKLLGGRVPQVCSGTQEYFRDVYDHLLRVSQQLDGLRDMVITAMQVNLNMISLSETVVTKRLASYAALVAVPTMVAGIYGMNFKNMPELNWELDAIPHHRRHHARARRLPLGEVQAHRLALRLTPAPAAASSSSHALKARDRAVPREAASGVTR